MVTVTMRQFLRSLPQFTPRHVNGKWVVPSIPSDMRTRRKLLNAAILEGKAVMEPSPPQVPVFKGHKHQRTQRTYNLEGMDERIAAHRAQRRERRVAFKDKERAKAGL